MADERARARADASDWSIRLREEPDDEVLIAAFEAWLAVSAHHRAAWAAMGRTVAAIERIPADMRGEDPLFVAGHVSPRRRVRARLGAALSKRRLGAAAALVAAACLAIFLAPSLYLHLRADYVSGAGEVRRIALDDGSAVVLGPNSAVSIDYEDTARTIHLLAGQAHFDVICNPTRPFRVNAAGLQTTVLGTAFDVRTLGDGASVAVGMGRVRVEAPGAANASARDLVAGQSAALGRSGLRFGNESAALVGAWKVGEVPLRHQTIAQAVEQVRPWFAGKIILMNDKLSAQSVTGIYNLFDPAAALALMVNPHGGTVTQITPWLIIVQ